MNEICTEVRPNFIYLRFGDSGFGFYIDQFTAFGQIFFKSGTTVVFDEVKSKLISNDSQVALDIPVANLIHQFLTSSRPLPSFEALEIPSENVDAKKSLKPIVDELTLSEITGLHRKVRQAMRKTSGLSRDLLPFSSDEVMDFLRVFPITLAQEQNKNYCVLGIYSYLLASSYIKSSKQVPVRWYSGSTGKPLQRLITVELLTLPFVLGLNKKQYQTFLNYVKPAFVDLYKNSFFNSPHSEKHIATHLGIDERTLKKDSHNA